MDFWKTYTRKFVSQGFGQGHMQLNTGERQNASLAKLEGRSLELKPGSLIFHRYSPEKRYLIVKDLSFDLMVSFYDINSKTVLAIRPTSPISRSEIDKIKGAIRRLRRPHMEIRIIGMQDGDATLVHMINEIQKLSVGELVEADLFGNQRRHLIIDLLTGKPYSLLLENRIYRPGELTNNEKKEDFDRLRSQLSFK